jgi:release factor glutamine methyltransferase
MILVGQALDEAAEQLGRAGIVRPRRESAALLAALQGLNAGALWLQRGRPLDAGMARRFWGAVGQRSRGVPFAYAVGRAGFRHLDLKCDSRALIPRPETEGLVELVLDWLRNVRPESCNVQRSRGVVADIGTGSGCIALALATEAPEELERVIAVEPSRDAAALARENVRVIRPTVPVEVREGCLLRPLEGLRCRVVVSNPPYLTHAEYEQLDVAVRRFEPREALVGGSEGLDIIVALLGGAKEVMEPGGLLALEIDERRAPRVEAVARACGWCSVSIHEDLFGRPRYLVATVPGEGGA